MTFIFKKVIYTVTSELRWWLTATLRSNIFHLISSLSTCFHSFYRNQSDSCSTDTCISTRTWTVALSFLYTAHTVKWLHPLLPAAWPSQPHCHFVSSTCHTYPHHGSDHLSVGEREKLQDITEKMKELTRETGEIGGTHTDREREMSAIFLVPQWVVKVLSCCSNQTPPPAEIGYACLHLLLLGIN